MRNSRSEKMKLVEFLGLHTPYSRRKSLDFLTQGVIKINGKTASDLTAEIDSESDIVSIQGREVRYTGRRYYFKFNKPSGVLSTLSDPDGRKDLLGYVGALKESVFPIGRLDRKTRGLLLFTNDGAWAQRILHPSFHLPKTYRVHLDQPMTKNAARRLIAGVVLEDGPVQCDQVSQDEVPTRVEVTISEGRNRIVRRVMEHLGFEVTGLKRIAIGSIRLGSLPEGEFAALSREEIDSV